MAALCARLARFTYSKNVILSNSRRCFADKMMTDPMEHATGLEKRELMAMAAGNEDPFDVNVLKRGAGTKDKPNLIPSAFEARIVGCLCEEDATCVNWMWLHRGSPRRCECGHWFKLIEKAAL